MITLTKKIKKQTDTNGQTNKRASIRDKLLVKEVQEMNENLPSTVKCEFPDPNNLAEFFLIVSPSEGLWKGGKFKFQVEVSEEYNMCPPKVKCLTKILHPNISSKGDVCLSILRLNTIDDGTSWLPTRRLKDVMFGINSIFTDLCDFSDPLNVEIAEEYARDSDKTKIKIRDFVQAHAR